MTKQIRIGLLALAVTFSAGIHAALAPEHLKEMPPLGYAFIIAAVIGGAIAIALIVRPGDRRITLLAGLFCIGQILVWGMFVTIRVPLFSGTPEPIETIALVSKAAELVGVAFALQLGAFSDLRRMTRPALRLPKRLARVAGPNGMRHRRFGLAALIVGVAAFVLVPSIAAGLPFGTPTKARAARSHCAARFPRVIRDGFPEPPMRFSSGGVLSTTLRMATGPVRVAGTRYTTATYDGTFPGPTLVICPGDNVTLRVLNDLKEPTNLHVHGLHVSPRGNGDNIFIKIPRGGKQVYRYALPLDHDPGAFWYHPHHHGDVAEQIFRGLSGAIVVEGGLDNLLARIPQRLMMIQSTELCGRNRQSVPFALSSAQRTSGTEPCDFPGQTIPDALTNERFTPLFVNGTLNPTVNIRPGQLQRWRIFNANNNRIIRLNMANQPMWVLAKDGNTLPRMRRVTTLMIPPGSRREIMVRGARRGSYRLTALPFAQFPGGNKPDLTSKNGGPTPNQTVLTIRSSGPAANIRLPRGLLSHREDLRKAHLDRRRNIVFSETPNPAGGTLFRINGDVFDPNVTPITMKLGSVEEWRLINVSSEWHTLHIHQNPFQVVSVDGRRSTGVEYEDNVAMPPCHVEAHPADPANPNCVAPSVVVIRMRPIDFTGRFVLHCHVSNHGDRGMMMAVQVLRHPTRRQLATSAAESPGMRMSGM